jgi:uncharacterized sulfatase
MADHGEFLGSYGLFRKGALHYDCLIRVPSFVSWPGRVPAGRRVPGLLQEIDLAPTVLGLLGMPLTPGMQGDDLSGNLLREEQVGRPWVYTESYRALWGPFTDCWTIRTETAKLNYYPLDRIGHLFDLAVDPGERENLFERPEHRGLRDEMTATLLECIHGQADPVPRLFVQF